MTPNELMIGDWMFIKDYPIKASPQKVGLEHFVRSLVEFEPIPLTPEILEKNGFKKDAFTNLSPDYYYRDDEYTICVNLNSTCDKSKSIWVEKRSSRFRVSIEESRHSLDRKPLYVHELQHALRLCGIEKEIVL